MNERWVSATLEDHQKIWINMAKVDVIHEAVILIRGREEEGTKWGANLAGYTVQEEPEYFMKEFNANKT